MERPAEDHLRTYFKTSSWHYRENQYFPGEKLELARHWDFVTDDPGHFLRFIARAYGQEPATWEPGENDPVGVVWIRGEDGQLYGVMARSNWWTVEGDEKQLPLHV